MFRDEEWAMASASEISDLRCVRRARGPCTGAVTVTGT